MADSNEIDGIAGSGRGPGFFPAATVLSVLLFLASIAAHDMVVGHWPGPVHPLKLLAGYAIGILAHEIVHAIAFALVGVPIRAIRIGYDSKQHIPYCVAHAPVSETGLVLVLLAPLLVVGVLPTAYAMDPDNELLAMVGALLISSASGDVLDAFGLFGGQLSRRMRIPPPPPERRQPYAVSEGRSTLRDALDERSASSDGPGVEGR